MIKDLVKQLYPLHRTLVSDGTDEALQIIAAHFPGKLEILRYPSLEKAWTWRVPERWVVHEAYLETAWGQRLADFAVNPLHVVSYATSIDKWVRWDELQSHLHYSDTRPRAIPWVFKFYERDWGFCLSKEVYDNLDKTTRYHAVIRSEFVPDALAVGFGAVGKVVIPRCLVLAHVCHPMQANDDAAGVAVAVAVANRLAADPLPDGSMGVDFLFMPETIGTICFLANNEPYIECLRGGLFIEMAGTAGPIAFQRTRQADHLLDRITRYVLQGYDFYEGAFREVIVNDEFVLNGPGVNVPCASLSRWPYPQYHTSDDTPDIIHEDKLVEMADVVEEIIRIYASNYTPKRTFRGPVFLSGYGLFDPELHKVIDQMMLMWEGEHTIFDIASELKTDYWGVREMIEVFRVRGLVKCFR